MFVNVNINSRSTFLVKLSWQEDTGDISIFDYELLKTWKGVISSEQTQKTASTLKMNVADYKLQLEQSFKESTTTFQWTLNENTLIIKKSTSKDLFFRLVVVQLKETDFTKSLPEFMAVIAQRLSQLSDELIEKENLAENLTTQNKKLLDKCNKYAKINEDITASLYTRFALAFNHLKGRLDSSAGESGSNSSKNLPVQEDEVSIADVPDQEKSRNSETDDSYGSETEEDTN